MAGETACNACGGSALEVLWVQEGVSIRARDLEARADVRTALCPRCGLVQTAPQPDEALLARFYAGQFRDLFAGDGQRIPGEGSRRDQAAWLEARLGPLAGLRVLEIGCYEGFLLELLRQRGARVEGIEPSADAARVGRERFGLEIRTGTLEEVPVEAGAFDLVLLSHVLEHLRDPRSALETARRALRVGGNLFVEVPNVLAPRPEHLVDFFTFDHLFNFSPRTLARMAERAGFAVTASDLDFPFPAFRTLAVALQGRADAGERECADPVAVEQCRRALRDYGEAHRAFVAGVQERVAGWVAAWRRRGTRVALYGAGAHTDHLLRQTDLARAALVAVIDGNPARRGERCHGLPVLAPDALPGLEIGAVVISSYDFQEEMVATVKRVCAAAPPEIRTLYERVQAFSSYRAAAAAPPP